MASANINWRTVFKLPLIVLVAVAAPVLAIWLVIKLNFQALLIPEVTMTILLISGVVALISVLVSAVLLFGTLDLTDKTRAFGMPEGTIRAVIALGLILIFAITSVFLYGQLRTPPVREIYDQTYAQLAEISANNEVNVIQKRCVNSQGCDNSTNPGDYHYDLWVNIPQTKSSEDFAKQLLTVISTLVVAVAGFYFGARSVATARTAVGSPEPLIRSINPKESNQGDLQIEVTITGKNLGTVTTVKFVLSGSEMLLSDVTTSATKIQGKLDIPQNQTTGAYKLVILGADGGEDYLDDAFKVK